MRHKFNGAKNTYTLVQELGTVCIVEETSNVIKRKHALYFYVL